MLANLELTLLSLLLVILIDTGTVLAHRRHNTKKTSGGDQDHSFPSDFQPIKTGDGRLIYLMKKYLQRAYPEGPAEMASVRPLLSNVADEKPFRAPRIFLAWSPIECKTTDMSLRKVGSIHNGKRNLVLKMYDRTSRRLCAWKRYKNVDEYSAEIAFFSVADHPNIVKPICIQRCAKTGLPGLLIDYVDGGESLAYAREHADDHQLLLRLSAQMYDVIKYMHWLGYIHADFKPENMMIDKEGNGIAIDFGFAIPIPYFKYYRGTPSTLAPELVKAVAGPIMENIDMWALVSSILQIFGLQMMPVHRKGAKRGHKWVPVRISKNQGFLFGKVPLGLHRNLRQLMYFGMNPDPNLRLFNTLSQREWFESLPFWNGIDFDSVGYDWLSVN